VGRWPRAHDVPASWRKPLRSNIIATVSCAVFLCAYGLAVASYQATFVAIGSALSVDVAQSRQALLVAVPVITAAGIALLWFGPTSPRGGRRGRAIWMSGLFMGGAVTLGTMLYCNHRVWEVSQRWRLVVREHGEPAPHAAEVLRRHAFVCWESSADAPGTTELLIVPNNRDRLARARRLLEEAGFTCVSSSMAHSEGE